MSYSWTERKFVNKQDHVLTNPLPLILIPKKPLTHEVITYFVKINVNVNPSNIFTKISTTDLNADMTGPETN